MPRYLSLFAFAAVLLSTYSCKKPASEEPKNTDTTTNAPAPKWRNLTEIDAQNAQAHATMVFDAAGALHVLYADGKNGGKAVLKRWDGAQWTTVGADGFSEGSASSASLVTDNAGKMYACYIENSATQTNKVRVMSWDGSAWKNVGQTLFPSLLSVPPVLSVQGGNLYAAFVSAPAVGKVMRYDGSAWSEFFVSAPERRVRSISAAGEHVAYIWDTTLGITQFDVLKRNGNNWSNLNFPKAIGPTSFSAGLNASGNLYIACEGKSPARVASVLTYNNGWANIGAQNFTTGIAANPQIVQSADSVNTMYMTYKDGNDKGMVMYYDKKQWNNFAERINTGTITHISVAVHPGTHTPYVVYTGADGKVTVSKFD